MTQGNKNVGWVSDSVTQQNRSQTTDQEASVLSYTALSQSTSGLPKGWVYARIGDVAAKTVQRVPHEKDEFIYVDIGSIDRNLKIISEPQTLLGKDAPSRARKIINTGDILVSLTRPNLNAVALIGQEFDNQIASTGFEVIKPILVDSRYIFAIVRSNEFIDAISKKVQGALYPAAKSDDVRQYEFLLPPLAEQHQIAAKLDELLAQVDSIKTRLDAIPNILKRFRQSVLSAAVNGTLIDVKNVEYDLVKNYVKFKQGVQVPIPEQKSEPSDDLVKFLRIINYTQKSEEYRYVVKPSKSDLIESEDVVMVRYGVPGFVGRGMKGLLANNLFRVIPDESQINKDFLFYYLQSPQVQSNIMESHKGGTMQAISFSAFDHVVIPKFSKLIQIQIVLTIEQLFTYADQIEQRVKDAQARVNHLTQSILAKAFRGELTADWRAQNSDLISGENSAEALLEKISNQFNKLNKTRKSL